MLNAVAHEFVIVEVFTCGDPSQPSVGESDDWAQLVRVADHGEAFRAISQR